MALAEKREKRGFVAHAGGIVRSGKIAWPVGALEILGKEQSLIRIDKAINILEWIIFGNFFCYTFFSSARLFMSYDWNFQQ